MAQSAVLVLRLAEGRLITGITNSRHAWPDEGVTRVPYFVHEDADLYEDGQRLIFCGREIEIPTAGDYITSHVGDTPVIALRCKNGSISAMVNRCAHRFDDLLAVRSTCV